MAKHRKPTDPTLRLVATGTVIVSAGLGLAMLGVGTAVAAAQPAERGANGGAETQSTGAPTNPNGFGSITSQRAVNDHDIGTHVSSQDTPHLGVGNVARNDQAEADASGADNTGTRPGDHALTVGPLVGYSPYTRPGTRETE